VFAQDKWLGKWVNALRVEELMSMTLIANYMDLKGLLQLSCAAVAMLMRGQSAAQIRETFGIRNDFTPEEEEAVRAENQWAYDE
jgi:S-phase kinase-associated protein 1